LRDAQEGKPPYFWAIFTEPEARASLLRSGWKATIRIISLGVVMDSLYQVIVLRWIYPIELMVIVLGLAFLPYLLLRGLISRMASRWTARRVPER
jgi:hypothetical protein